MRHTFLEPRFVDEIPEHLDEGVLYVCERYRTAAHKCCCGCGEEVVTPLTPAGWSVRKRGDTITLYPSIGNWSFRCQSHYLVVRNKVVWAHRMSERQISKVRMRDRIDTDAYVATENRKKKAS